VYERKSGFLGTKWMVNGVQLMAEWLATITSLLTLRLRKEIDRFHLR